MNGDLLHKVDLIDLRPMQSGVDTQRIFTYELAFVSEKTVSTAHVG